MVALSSATLLTSEAGCWVGAEGSSRASTLSPDFVEAFTRLARSLDGEAELNLVGRRLVQSQLLRILRQRRALDASTHAVWSAEPRVVVIVGLPRTGTTLLHHLLVSCFVTEFIPLHEALEPVVRPEADGRVDRRARAGAYLGFVDRLSPELRLLHPMSVDGPEECDVAFQLTGMSDWFSIAHRIPAYTRWSEAVNRTEAYATYRRLLGRLRPRAEVLVLKSPSHLGHLGELVETFPDSSVVWLHRPVAEVVPSFARLVRAARAVTSSPGVHAELQSEWLPRLERRVDRSGPWLADPRVVHVHYDALVHDTDRTLSRVAWHASLRERPGASPPDAVRASLRSSSPVGPGVSSSRELRVAEFDPWLA